jgi:hypothetical protein
MLHWHHVSPQAPRPTGSRGWRDAATMSSALEQLTSTHAHETLLPPPAHPRSLLLRPLRKYTLRLAPRRRAPRSASGLGPCAPSSSHPSAIPLPRPKCCARKSPPCWCPMSLRSRSTSPRYRPAAATRHPDSSTATRRCCSGPRTRTTLSATTSAQQTHKTRKIPRHSTCSARSTNRCLFASQGGHPSPLFAFCCSPTAGTARRPIISSRPKRPPHPNPDQHTRQAARTTSTQGPGAHSFLVCTLRDFSSITAACAAPFCRCTPPTHVALTSETHS